MESPDTSGTLGHTRTRTSPTEKGLAERIATGTTRDHEMPADPATGPI